MLDASALAAEVEAAGMEAVLVIEPVLVLLLLGVGEATVDGEEAALGDTLAVIALALLVLVDVHVDVAEPVEEAVGLLL